MDKILDHMVQHYGQKEQFYSIYQINVSRTSLKRDHDYNNNVTK